MNTLVLLVFATCQLTTSYVATGTQANTYAFDAPRTASINRVEVYKSKEDLFKKSGGEFQGAYYEAMVVVLKDGNIVEQMTHYEFSQQMEKARLAKTKPAMPKFFSCETKWRCTGNEQVSTCLCSSKKETFAVEIDPTEECAKGTCVRPWPKADNVTFTNVTTAPITSENLLK